MITAHTRPIVLLGDPLAHSFSPAMHNTAFAELKLDLVYLALPVPSAQLHAAMQGFRAWHLPGANVTIPHKEAVLPLLDALCPNAQRAQAVNTLFWQDDVLVGDNTDVTGIMTELVALRRDWHGKTALLVGSGGAARAAAVALGDLGFAQVGLIARNLAAGVGVTGVMQGLFPDIAWSCHTSTTQMLLDLVSQADLVINATPIGMVGQATGMAMDRRLVDLLGRETIVYDMVYNPSRTMLIEAAESRGLQAVNGIGMLVGQGAAAFLRWTGREAPVVSMRRALLAAMAGPDPDAPPEDLEPIPVRP
ncbi:MAG: shikimate dehydrogenase [Candidatus Sericytochromatia bacterium]|nr:shikimate dehydrogenase [Candidatus Sericytochromatia bacterium]